MDRNTTKVTRLYPGMYLVTNGHREIRISRHDEAPILSRWYLTEDSLFADAHIDETSTYEDARKQAIAILQEDTDND